MKDKWMNDCLVMHIENDVVSNIDNDTIMQQL